MILHCWETTASWQVVRWLVPADDVLAQTILHAPLAAFTSVPGPHGLQVAGGGGEGDGGGGLGEGGGGEGGARGERTRLAQVPPEGSCPKGVPQQVVAIPSSI